MRDILSKLDQINFKKTSLEDNKKIIKEDIEDLTAQNHTSQEDEDLYQIGDEFGISFNEDFEISSTIVDILEDGIVIELDDFALETITNEGISFIDVQLDEEKQKGVDGKACWKGYKRMGTKKKGGKTVDNCVKMGEDLEEAKAPVNFDQEDLLRLQTIDDLKSIKQKAFELISRPSERPMKPEKVEWFKNALANKQSKNEVIKLMYDLFLSGEGFGVLGSRSSMTPNSYRRKFKDDVNDDVSEAEYQGRKVPLGKPMQGDVKKSKVYVRKPNGKVVKVNFGDKKMKIKKSNPARRKSFRARHNCSNPGPRWKARYWSCRAW